MHITLTMRLSIDGRITRGKESDTFGWGSPEDAQFLAEQIAHNNLIVMGSGTYEVAKSHIQLTPERLRVVLTRSPEKYEKDARAGMLEFSNEEPAELIARLKQAGYTNMLLFGGAQTAGRFLEFINELLLTVEPVLFGQGKPIISGELSSVPLQLVEHRRLNHRGTLLLRYKVLKNAV